MAPRAASGVKGLYKKHSAGCANRREPTACDCPWYARYKDVCPGLEIR